MPKENLNRIRSIRLSEEEDRALVEQADRAGVKPATLVRYYIKAKQK